MTKGHSAYCSCNGLFLRDMSGCQTVKSVAGFCEKKMTKKVVISY